MSGTIPKRWIKRDDLGRGAIVDHLIADFTNSFAFNHPNLFTNLVTGDAGNVESQVQDLMVAKGRFKEMICFVDTNTRDAIFVITLRINGINSLITVSISALGTGIFRSPAGAVAEFKDEDRVSITTPNSGTVGAANVRWVVSMEYDN